MKSIYHITVYNSEGTIKAVAIYTVFNKETIQNDFNAFALSLDDGDELEYSKEDKTHFYPALLYVRRYKGKLQRLVTKGEKEYWKPYFISKGNGN